MRVGGKVGEMWTDGEVGMKVECSSVEWVGQWDEVV